MKNKYYILHLPVFKQGDDLASCIDLSNKNCNNDLVKYTPDQLKRQAFIYLAEQYEEAAKICRYMADLDNINNYDENKQWSISSADTHYIGIDANSDIFGGLIQDQIIVEEQFEDDEENEENELNDEEDEFEISD